MEMDEVSSPKGYHGSHRKNLRHTLATWWHRIHPVKGLSIDSPPLRAITRDMAVIADKPLTVAQCLRDIADTDKRIATEVHEYMIDVCYELDNIVKRFQLTLEGV